MLSCLTSTFASQVAPVFLLTELTRDGVFGKESNELVGRSEALAAESATENCNRRDVTHSRSGVLGSKDMAVLKPGMGINPFGRDRGKTNDPETTTNPHPSMPIRPPSHHQAQPRFVRRTVLPNDPQLTEARLRPSVHHVPGSYRSEMNYRVDSEKTDPNQSSAVVGLSVEDGPQRPISGPVTAPSRKSSLRSMGSTGSVRLYRPNGLERSSAEPLISNEQLPLPDTFSLDHGDEHNDEQPLLQPLPNIGDLVKQEKPESSVQKQPTPPISALFTTADGPRLSELLAELPPVKQDVVDSFKGHHLTAFVERDTQTVPLAPESLFAYESKRPTNGGSPEGSIRHPVSLYYDNAPGSPHAEPPSLQQQVLKTQVDASGKPSSHRRAASRSSSTSSDSTILYSKDVVKNVSEDFHDDATRLLQPQPLFFRDDRVSPDYIRTEASLDDGPGYPQQSHHAAGSEDPEEKSQIHGQSPHPDRYWIQQLRRRASDKPYQQEPPNLTARPFYRPRRTSTKPMDSNNTGFLPLREDTLPTNNGGSLQASEGKKTQFVTGESAEKQMTSDSFSKVILDLETLLSEALSVAKHAADRGDTDALPAILEEASKMLKNEVHGFDEDCSDSSSLQTGSEDSRYHSSTDLDLSSQHRDHVVIIEPDDEDLHSAHFQKVRGSTPYPSSPAPASRQPSMVPGDEASQAIPLKNLSGAQTKSTNRERVPTLPRNGSPEKEGYFELLRGLHLPENGATSSPRRVSIRSPTLPTAPEQTDWAYVQPQRQPSNTLQVPQARVPTLPTQNGVSKLSTSDRVPDKEETGHVIRQGRPLANVPSSDDVQNYIALHNQPPIQPRASSAGLRSRVFSGNEDASLTSATISQFEERDGGDPSGDRSHDTWLGSALPYQQNSQSGTYGQSSYARRDTLTSQRSPRPQRQQTSLGQEMTARQNDYRHHRPHRRHHSSSEHHGLRLSRSHRHAPIARDWKTPRKRWVAAIACISTALLGLIVGIYAGEVPAIQYTLADEHHYTILGNVFLYIGLAIPTVIFWPLPLLHGRKPYTLIALALLLPLQFPQAIVLNAPRNPSAASYRVGLLLSRALSGVAMGFANINFKTTLLDLFGASLQSGNPHQEIVNENDVRRHGGGMGVWLGIWTWCFMGSIGVGFFIGALVISGLSVDWGFYITIVITAFVLFLNVLTPEVRRSAHRRWVGEARTSTDITKRVGKGEVMMHITSTGPTWWWEEVFAGQVLCARMLKQPGFFVLSLYLGWIYGQIVILIVLLGALTSKYYRFRPQYVGLCVLAIPLGALLAVPFQKASLFSRSRRYPPRTDSMTFQKQFTWSSHLLRRVIFMILLPFADLAYTLASSGPPVHYMVPTIFAGLIGFLSNLAIAECNGLIMETYDTSDLQPGMIGRPRTDVPESVKKKRTIYTCYPRVTAGCAISQAFAFLIAAAATGAGGAIERRLGAQTATAVVAGVLLVLTLLLIGVLWRFKEVQVIPTDRFGTGLSLSGDEPWRPVIIGTPSGRTRRMNLLELGRQSRWSEIRRKNKLTGLR